MQTLSISKEFPVSPERLYQAWTNPEDLKQWWHPMGNKLVSVENDLRQGGNVRYTFNTGSSSEDIEITGTYDQVQPNKALDYSWIWQLPHQPIGNGDYKLHIRFEPAGEGSRIDVQQENFGSEEAVQPHREGWERSLDDLKSYLGQGR